MNPNSPDSALLPPLYADWIEQLLKGPIPDETEATCLDCAMCPTKNVIRTDSDHLFNDKTKCCTYFPKLPNFLVGKILLDQDPVFTPGRVRFLGQFFIFTVVTPLGVLPPPAENARYGAFQQDFGKNVDLRCPYYLDQEGGLCGIWKHRNAKCSTWFCKHVRGQTGLHFWRALKDLLQRIEEKLTVWCIHELAVGDADFRQLFPLVESDLETFQKQQAFYYAISRRSDDRLQRQTWGEWFGAERSFFEECARLMERLKWDDIAEIGGSGILRETRFLEDCFRQLLGWKMPQYLSAKPFKSININPDTVRVWGYSQYDPIDLPRSLFEVLTHFDGSLATNVVENIRIKTGLQVTDQWLKKLCDFGILS